MEKSSRIKKLAMFLLRNSDKIDDSSYKSSGIRVFFNRGDLENDYWQQSFIEFKRPISDYSIRYFPRRFIRDFTFFGNPHKTYFEGWYTFVNGEYGIYEAKEEDILVCKKVLKQIKTY